jgi:hypothetical protein
MNFDYIETENLKYSLKYTKESDGGKYYCRDFFK